jgi:hypothetical protein
MFDRRDLVTGSIENVIVMLRMMAAASLLRVEHISRAHGYETVKVIVGDDSAVRAYYEQMQRERDSLREQAIQASAAGEHARAQTLFRQSDELLCRYQERSACVNERPFSLSDNIYGWCVGSMLLMNLGHNTRFAWTRRGATLEECVRWGCEGAGTKGTTFEFSMEQLPISIEDRVALVKEWGGSDDACAFLRMLPEREAEKARKAAETANVIAQRQATEAAFAPRRAAILSSAEVDLTAAGAVVHADRSGLTVRGAAFNPSLRLTVEHHGWKIVRTDFDGVRKEHSNVAFGSEISEETIIAAANAAWAAMKPAVGARKGRRAS